MPTVVLVIFDTCQTNWTISGNVQIKLASVSALFQQNVLLKAQTSGLFFSRRRFMWMKNRKPNQNSSISWSTSMTTRSSRLMSSNYINIFTQFKHTQCVASEGREIYAMPFVIVYYLILISFFFFCFRSLFLSTSPASYIHFSFLFSTAQKYWLKWLFAIWLLNSIFALQPKYDF